IAEADLAVTKTDDPDAVIAGNDLTYRVTVTNNGPSDATGVTLVDTLPSGVTFQSASSGCNRLGRIVTCDLGGIDSGNHKQVTIVVTVDSSTTGSLSNSATVSGNEYDPNSSNNTDTENTAVDTEVSLTLTKTDNPDPVNAGGNLTYEINVTNNGPSDATGVTLVDTLPSDVTFVWASSGCNELSGIVTCDLDTLPSSNNATVTIVVMVASPLPVGTVLTNQVTLDSDQTTPVTITEVTDVTTASELTVSKIDVPDPVPAGGDLTYIISYQNGGTAPAEDVVITEMYDRQVTFVSADPAPWGGTDNVWDIGDLAVGANGSVRVTVRVNTPLPDGTTLTNCVTIDSAYTSPQTYDETTGVSAPDLAITAAHEPSLFSPGKLMTYTVIYSNTGSLGAKDVVITTTLPLDTIYVDGDWTSSDGQSYTHLVDGAGALSSGASGQAYFVVQYPKYPDQPQQIGAVEFNTPFVISESG
ncbi:MAG: DUF11 domain-containing protein, partial [Anaerolineae bacterium]|nr:DUF11 domain-containing protein [Anaerolineae bacterium]